MTTIRQSEIIRVELCGVAEIPDNEFVGLHAACFNLGASEATGELPDACECLIRLGD